MADVSAMPLKLRKYWTKGEGAIKIRWGTGGDFNRCVKQLTKAGVPVHMVKGACANLHKEAIGIWPGQHKGKTASVGEMSALVASMRQSRHTGPDIGGLVAAMRSQRSIVAGDYLSVSEELSDGVVERTARHLRPAGDSSGTYITHAGVLLQADDTGRWLMLQRALDDGDENGGLWEFPGGGLEDDEGPVDAARREFAEECGFPLPTECGHRGEVVSQSGNYVLHIFSIPEEGVLDLDVTDYPNPDDPDGDFTEALAWWDPEHIVHGGYHIRPEVQSSDWDEIRAILDSGITASAGENMEPVTDAIVDGEDAMVLQSLSNHHEQMSIEIDDFIAAHPDTALKDELEGYKTEAQAFVTDVTSRLEAPEAVDDDYIDGPTEEDALVASVASSGTLLAPPDEWFEPFDLEGPTPITITADGRVYGHLADWKSCHRSPSLLAAGQCVKPPSDPNPAFFYSGGQVLTASGALIDVGRLTVGGGHADTRLGLVAALEHYDDASAVAAVVQVKEDEHGIGLFGSIVADASPEQVAALRRSPISGDWRKERGRYRLVAAHAVNTGGYPIARGLVASITDSAFVTTGRVACSSCGEEHDLPESVVASVRDILSREFEEALESEKQALVAGMVDDWDEMKNQLVEDMGNITEFLETAVGDDDTDTVEDDEKKVVNAPPIGGDSEAEAS